MVATMRLKSSRLPEIAKKFPAEVSAILRAGTLATEAGGKVRSPVLTGFLRNSHGTEGVTPGSLAMRVTVGAEYAPWVHDGTRRMPPRPWLRETTEQTFPQTIAALRQIERQL